MQKSKIFWSFVEREKIVKRAVELHEADSELEGLDLLREAIKSLPRERRRQINSKSQAAWFHRAVKREIDIKKSGEGLGPVVQSLAALSHESLTLEKCWGRSECDLLRAILAEIRWIRIDLNRR